MKTCKVFLVGLMLSVLLFAAVKAEETRLLRFPDIHGERIVFVYGGDLWTVSSDGGLARRLTSFDGYEAFPKFSPDGELIAFTAAYDGNGDVYVMPAEGGEPRRLTYCPSGGQPSGGVTLDDWVIDWYPNGKEILFRSARETFPAIRLFRIGVDGGFPEALKLPESGLASLSPDGSKIAYNRNLREFRTWKRYYGGRAQDIWIYDLKTDAVEKITDWKGTDNMPMWHEDKIYFNSDREHKLNIYCYDTKTKDIRKITNHTEYDVKWPSLGPGAIVYENGGYLYVLDLATEKTKKITVEVPSERILTRPTWEKVEDLILDYSLSPSAKRALFTARGEVFTVPEEKGEVRNLTQTPVIREIAAAWSPDGKWVAYLSDRTGEYELYIRPQDGTGEEERITYDGECYRFRPVWSPDSKKLLYSDKRFRLFYVDIEKKEPVLVDKAEVSEIHDYVWSSDSKWIAYSKNNPAYFASVYLYSLDKGKVHQITDDLTDDFLPAFDPEGKYLYFISARTFSPTFGDFERSDYVYRNVRNIYLATLQADSLSPFAPESDEEKVDEDEEKEDDEDKDEDKDKDKDKKKDKEKGKDKSKDIQIDLEGIDQRIVGVPIESGNYTSIAAAEGKLFYLATPAIRERGGSGNGQNELRMFDMEEREENTLISGIDGYNISPDGEKIIYKSGNTYGIIDAKKGSNKVGDGKLSTSGMEMKVDPQGEWKQVFEEAWRLERDFFYDPDMHGVDWKGMKKKYGQLVPHVAHRWDLTYLLGELIGELTTSHTYVGGGKMPKSKPVNVGLLGADFEPDKNSGFYRFKKIYKGENWEKDRRAPLTEPGVVVKEGEYLIAVNGDEVRYPANPYQYFEKTVDKQVKIRVNDKPSSEGARELTVKPTGSEYQLRYLDWVETNRRKVDEATDGKVGYIHVPNTSIWGLNEFSRAFYAQTRKEGLIVDVRYNAGGMIPDMFMEHLQRRILSLWSRREGPLSRTPGVALHGHMACIINEDAGSGGDAFPYYFRELGLGPLIGKRTWGGLVGISRGVPLMDGGYVTVPEFAFINLEGQWDVENYGVDPDIEVDNRPDLVIKGQDPQLERAIQEVMKKVKEEPKKLPGRPKYPIKK
ncbi:MAG: S41 family peptidase [Candidatus Zixiibacteriota bacterium]